MTTTTTTSPLMVNVMTTYLKPLLVKHEKGQVLVYEDLASSLQAAEGILQLHETETDYAAVKEKLTNLHKEQLRAYQQAAKQALLEYARTSPLPSVQQQAEPTAHVQYCLRTLLDNCPGWKLLSKSAILALLQKRVPARALEAYHQAHPTKAVTVAGSKSETTKALTPVAEDDKEAETAEAGEEVEINEGEFEEEPSSEEDDVQEGEDDEGTFDDQDEGMEEEEVAVAPATTEAKGHSKRKGGILAKKRAAAAAKATGKTVPRKKNEKAKASGPKASRGGRRVSRRGGRGGGGVK